MIRRLRRRLTVILTALTGSVLIAILLFTMFNSIAQAKRDSTSQLVTDSGYMVIGLNASDDNKHNMDVIEEMSKEKNYIVSLKIDDQVQESSSHVSADERRIIKLAEKTVSENGVTYSVTTTSSALPNLFSGFSFSEQREFTDDSDDAPGVGKIQITNTDATTYHTEAYAEADWYASDAEEDSDGVNVVFSYAADGEQYPDFQYKNTSYRVSSIGMTDMRDDPDVNYNLMIIKDLSEETYQIFLICLLYIALMLSGIALLTACNWFLTKLVVKPTEEGIKRQTEFVAAASHELRSPLTTLRASLSAAEISDNAEETEKYQSCALREADRMGRLINDLLILAGSDSKKWGIEKKLFDVDTFLIETHEQYEPIAKEKGHKLKLILPPDALGEFSGDRDRIRQILSVLLDNAMEYSPEGSTVSLEARKKSKKLLLSVIDEGTSISDNEKNRIFDRFYCGDKSRSDKAHFGLGLSVAKELAQLHGGTLSVGSEPEGGNRFTLTL